jgi:hypothetical protein
MADFYRHRPVAEPAPGGSDAMTLVQQVPFPELPDLDEEENNAEATALYHRAVALIQAEFEEKTWVAFCAASWPW